MRIARPGVNLLVHGKSASAFVAWNKAGAESNDHTTLPLVGGIQESWRLAFGLPFVGGGIQKSWRYIYIYILDVQAALKRGLYLVIQVDSCFRIPVPSSHILLQTSGLLPFTSTALVSWLVPHAACLLLAS